MLKPSESVCPTVSAISLQSLKGSSAPCNAARSPVNGHATGSKPIVRDNLGGAEIHSLMRCQQSEEVLHCPIESFLGSMNRRAEHLWAHRGSRMHHLLCPSQHQVEPVLTISPWIKSKAQHLTKSIQSQHIKNLIGTRLAALLF